MFASIPLFRVAGTSVRVQYTLLLLLIALGTSASYHNSAAAAGQRLSFVALAFLSILAHEFGHVAAARLFGIRTPTVMLWPLGGYARLERAPRGLGAQVVIAAAGPLANLAIALGVSLPGGGTLSFGAMRGDLWLDLARINLMLAVFNLLPIYPMDGGQILRALLLPVLGEGRTAAVMRWSGRAGAVLLGVLGAYFRDPLLVLVGLFIFFAAGAMQPPSRPAAGGPAGAAGEWSPWGDAVPRDKPPARDSEAD